MNIGCTALSVSVYLEKTTHADMPMSEKFWYKTPEMIVALSALVVSIVTVVIGVYSAYVDRSYARALFWPRIEISKSYSQDGSFKYQIVNSGNGHAVIKHAKVTYKDNAIQRWIDIPDIPRLLQSHMSNRIVSSQMSIEPISISGAAGKDFLQLDTHIRISLCYCSVYEECWTTSRSNLPQSVDQCEISKENAFLQ